MAGEDTQIIANGTVNVLTIIPSEKMSNDTVEMHNKLNNNKSITNGNGKVLEITALENGKLLAVGDEKSNSLHTEFDDVDVSCGWGLFRPFWLQYFATKQAFLVIFCLTWVSLLNCILVFTYKLDLRVKY